MRFVLFYHSLLSDWNHGNAHFLRGVTWELLARGHEVAVYEPADGWSRTHLLASYGASACVGFQRVYPGLRSVLYERDGIDLERVLDGADVVIVHEWNDPELVRRIGECGARARNSALSAPLLLFHDTHHRAVTDPAAMAAYDLHAYDGVLAFGRVLRDLYLERGWTDRAWIWHEAADTRVFRPAAEGPHEPAEGDLVWIGNWGDEERSAELHEFLLEPVRRLGLRAALYGVRYPSEALEALAAAGIEYRGWLPNYEAPGVFARYRVTVHVPRRPYVAALPGIPTIRVFEALACDIPLVCAPWQDSEGLFTPGADYLEACDGAEMTRSLRTVLDDGELARSLRAHGLRTIRARHTCAHRTDELLSIVNT